MYVIYFEFSHFWGKRAIKILAPSCLSYLSKSEGGMSQTSDLQVHFLWWLLGLPMVLEWQAPYLEQECYLEGYTFRTVMPTCIIHDEQKVNSAMGRGSAEVCTQPDSCGRGWIAAWAGGVAARLPAATSHQGCRQHLRAHLCEHPLSADFGGGGKQLCASLLAAIALLTALLQGMLMPVLPLS